MMGIPNSWIGMFEQRPPIDTRVLLTDGEDVDIGRRLDEEQGARYFTDDNCVLWMPTHWMYLPEPPA